MTARYLVTGAYGGLGAEVCKRLRAQGAEVHGMVRAVGGPDVDLYGYHQMDFSHATPSQVATAVLKIASAFDGVVHTAGSEVVHPLVGHQDAQYNRAMAAAHSAFGILMAAAEGAVMKGGSIVMMSSVAAHRGVAGMVAYSAGKAAIEAMVRSGALELKRRSIRVNCVAAGAFRSPMHDRITRGMNEASQDAYAQKHPMGIGALSHVADAVMNLLQGASWQTGSTVVVDGGFLAG